MSDLLQTGWHQIWTPQVLLQVHEETIENRITMATKFSLRLFHTIRGISKQSNLQGISTGHLIQPSAQSGAMFRSSWEHLQGGGLHSVPGQLVPLLDQLYSEKRNSFVHFYPPISSFQHRSLQIAGSLSTLFPHAVKSWMRLASLFLLWHTPQLLSYPDPDSHSTWLVEAWYLVAEDRLGPVLCWKRSLDVQCWIWPMVSLCSYWKPLHAHRFVVKQTCKKGLLGSFTGGEERKTKQNKQAIIWKQRKQPFFILA